MRIGIAVHGRFYAFELGSALRKRGHDVTVITNYPRWAVNRWDPQLNAKSLVGHGVLTRLAGRLSDLAFERQLHTHFGKRAARHFSKHDYDVIECWSGIGEESLLLPRSNGQIRLLVRASSHIRVQRDLLEQEMDRSGIVTTIPSPWRIDREEAEYGLADYVEVPSSFVKNTFLERGFSPEKVSTLQLGVRTEAFRASRDAIEKRIKRVETGEPLRVLFVGAISLRKGFYDFAHVARILHKQGFVFRAVGPTERTLRGFAGEHSECIQLRSAQLETELRREYEWADIFFLPTIEDGFAVVLVQAQAAGLPIIATTNCSAPDVLREGQNGWVVPIRDPDACIERLSWCGDHRNEFTAMIETTHEDSSVRTWDEVADDYESFCETALQGARP